MNRWFCCGGATEQEQPRIQKLENPAERARAKLHNWSNAKISGCLSLTDLESKQGMCARILAAALYMWMAVGAVMVWQLLGRQIHVAFWVGLWPQVTLFVTALALALAFLLLTRVRIIRYFRFQELREEPYNERPLRANTQLGRLKSMVLVSAFMALISVGLGLMTGWQGVVTRDMLREECSNLAEPRIRTMQEVSDRLVQFQKKCRDTRDKDTAVSECPGFRKRFKGCPYVAYLLRLEKYESCTGFCAATDPLVNKRKGKASTDPLVVKLKGKSKVDDQLSCAEVISEHVEFATLLVAVPCVTIGLFLAIMAWFLLNYDQL